MQVNGAIYAKNLNFIQKKPNFGQITGIWHKNSWKQLITQIMSEFYRNSHTRTDVLDFLLK
jgi:hypothetical protein